MAERYRFPFGNTVGVQENLISINEEATKGLRQRIDRFKFLVREQGLSPNDAKKIVIEEFQLNRNPKAGTPKWMSKGKTELIAEGFDYKASARGPKNVGGVEKYLQKRKQVIGEGRKFEERIKRTKQKTGLGKVYEMAHTANIFQAKKLGIDYPINALAIQTQNVNNKVAEVLNDELKPLYRKQLKLFNKMKRKNTPALVKQMDKINFQIGELVATGGSQGDVAANVLKPIIVDPDTVKGKILDLGFDTSTEVMTSPGATTKATAAGSVNDVMARANVDLFLSNVKTDAAANGPICRIVGAKQSGGSAVSCVDAVNDALEKDPKRLAQEINKSNAGGTFNKIKNSSTKFLTALKENPNLLRGGLPGKIALGLGTVAAGVGAGALVKQFRNDDPSTYLTNDSQMEGMIISDVEDKGKEVDDNILLDNQFKLELAGAAGLTAPIAKGVYQTARGVGEAGPLPEGVGRTRAALGLSKGVLGKGLWALGAPIVALPSTVGYVAQDIRAGKDAEEIATNPLNYLGAAFMNPAVKALGRAGASRGLLGIASLGLAGTAAAPLLPALSIGAGLAALGTLGYQGYKAVTGRNRSDEDFFR